MSGYFWHDVFFEKKEFFEEIRALMNDCLDALSDEEREYAIYRFGLEGQKEHSLKETAEHFSIAKGRVASLDSGILRMMGIRMPSIRHRSSRLKDYLEE